MFIKKESVGQRGKYAQDRVQDHLKLLNEKHAAFTFIRLQDARAAGGALKKQLSDFICWWQAMPDIRFSIPLEVKSTEHDYRIPKASLSQLPMLNKTARAGAHPYVLVLFKGIGKWRIAPIDLFHFGQTSWDMSELPLFDTAQAALESTGVFPKL